MIEIKNLLGGQMFYHDTNIWLMTNESPLKAGYYKAIRLHDGEKQWLDGDIEVQDLGMFTDFYKRVMLLVPEEKK